MTDQPIDLAQAAFNRGEPLTTALRDILDNCGRINTVNVGEFAQIFNISQAEVHGVISFYSDFRTQKPGRQVIKICQAEACQAVGARALTSHVQNVLGIKLGETTPDEHYTLEATFCLGLCATGPAAQKDQQLFAKVTPASFEAKILGVNNEAAE